MKAFIALAMISAISSVSAAENIICQISKNGELIQELTLDLDSSKRDVIASYNDHNRIILSRTMNNNLTVTLVKKDKSTGTTLDLDMVKSMDKGKTFGLFPSVGNEEGVTCYNMKNETVARRLAYSPKEIKMESCSEKVVQDRMPKVKAVTFSDGNLQAVDERSTISK